MNMKPNDYRPWLMLSVLSYALASHAHWSSWFSGSQKTKQPQHPVTEQRTQYTLQPGIPSRADRARPCSDTTSPACQQQQRYLLKPDDYQDAPCSSAHTTPHPSPTGSVTSNDEPSNPHHRDTSIHSSSSPHEQATHANHTPSSGTGPVTHFH